MPPARRIKKSPLTHFLCLPLVTPRSRPQLENSLQHFTNEVTLSDFPDDVPQLPVSAIRPPGTLHLTLGVMSLPSATHLQAAITELRSLNLTSLLPPPGPLSISLKGLHPMHSPTSTSVLYAAPHDPSERLYPFASAVRHRFLAAGMLVPDDRPLKLHATIFNTVYARGPDKARIREMAGGTQKVRGRGRPQMALDMTFFIERYMDYIWASDVGIERVAICEMGAKEISGGQPGRKADAEYTEVASVAIRTQEA